MAVRQWTLTFCLWLLIVHHATCGEAVTSSKPCVFDLPKIQAQYNQLQSELRGLFAKGDAKEIEKNCRAAIQLVPHSAVAHYNLACALAHQDRKTEALESLRRAVEFGFRDVKILQQDTDLEPLRQEKEFVQILKRASENRDSQKPPPDPWHYDIVPDEVHNGAVRVTETNVAWDSKHGLFRVFFKLPSDSDDQTPVIRGHGEVGRLLRTWYEQGTAAGNRSDLYDNHDNDHSNMAFGEFPQLTRIEFCDAAKERKLHFGLQASFFYNGVVLGNSSTANVGSPFWRSQPRLAYCDARLASILYSQYINNHLYLYPEHRDHDPGHNGDGGYGDVFPANTPYVIISQGSSGSDRPFLDAVACTLAAFRPEVKQFLAASHTLMPTVQMIFRFCNKQVHIPNDYLTGAAHPTVFRSEDLDVLAMVKMAHAMTDQITPPAIQLRVVEEDHGVVGRDYFDVADRERLFDTPAAIARVFRTTKYERRMVVSAEDSRDLHHRPLTWQWVLLRGDADAARIRPLNKAGSVAEVTFSYTPRRAIRPGSDIRSNRTDIGVFVSNGVYYSAPGFITSLTLDSERRVYKDKHLIQDVWYGQDYNYVDPLIDFRKKWWDHYRYDDKDRLLGWTRHADGQTREFTADGALVQTRDELGRPLLARTVQYVARGGDKTILVLEETPGTETLHYAYESDTDQVGSIILRGKVTP